MEKPIYIQIEEKLKDEIDKMKVNSPIDSERELSKRLDASRMTVRKAIDNLVDEGYLYRETNKGTFIAHKNVRIKNSTLQNNSKNINYKLINFDVKYAVDKNIMEKLNINEDVSIIRAIRLVSDGEKPLYIEEFYINRDYIEEKNINKFDILLDINKALENNSISQEFKGEMVPLKYATHLKLPIYTPIISVYNTIIKNDGSPIMYFISYYNSENKKVEIVSKK